MRVVLALCLLFTVASIVLSQRRVSEKKIINSEKIGVGVLKGPEGLAWDPVDDDIVYTGIADGSVRRLNVTSGVSTLYAYSVPSLDPATRASCGASPLNEAVCGRPLGLTFDKANNLIVADAYKGLLRVSRANPNNVEVLVNSYNGVPFKMLNSVEILKDGRTAYFTDTSQIYTRAQFVSIVLVNKPDGRLFKFDLITKQLQVVISDLRFANGVALSRDESFLVINECSERRIRRYYLKGRKAGRNDVFIQDIGGYNDNIKADGQGNFYVGLFGESNDEVSAVQNSEKLQNIFLTYVPPTAALGMVPPFGLVKKIDERGRVNQVYIDRTASFVSYVSEAEVHDGYMYFGSVINPFLTRINLATDLSTNGLSSSPTSHPHSTLTFITP